MENKFVSLIYPDKNAMEMHAAGECIPNITENVSSELGLVEIFDMKSAEISDFYTRDIETIKYRQQTIRDLIAVPDVLNTLSEIGIHARYLLIVKSAKLFYIVKNGVYL